MYITQTSIIINLINYSYSQYNRNLKLVWLMYPKVHFKTGLKISPCSQVYRGFKAVLV